MIAMGRDRWWLGFNLLGMGLFAYMAASSWVAPELKTQVPDTSQDAIVGWAITALPIPTFYAVVNFGWLMQAIVGAFRSGTWLSVLVVLGVAWAWYALIMMDYAHR